MPSFASILDTPSQEINFPKLPVGSYTGLVKGMPKFDKSARKQTPYVEFTIQILEAQGDVDPDELTDFGPLAELEMPMTFYYETEGGAKRLLAFLDNCDTDEEATPRQRIDETPGKTVIVEVKHEISADGQFTRARIDGTAKYGE